MKRKRHTDEEIIKKLRQIEADTGTGKPAEFGRRCLASVGATPLPSPDSGKDTKPEPKLS